MPTREFQEKIMREIAQEAQRRKMSNLREWLHEVLAEVDVESIVAEVLAEKGISE